MRIHHDTHLASSVSFCFQGNNSLLHAVKSRQAATSAALQARNLPSSNHTSQQSIKQVNTVCTQAGQGTAAQSGAHEAWSSTASMQSSLASKSHGKSEWMRPGIAQSHTKQQVTSSHVKISGLAFNRTVRHRNQLCARCQGVHSHHSTMLLANQTAADGLSTALH